MDSISLMRSNISTVHSIEVKVAINIISSHSTCCIDLVEIRISSIFTGVQTRILVHSGLLSQSIKSTLMSNWYTQLSSNLVCI